MKILLVITSLGTGGAERLVTNLADRFAADGHEVLLSYLHGQAEMMPGDARVRCESLAVNKSLFGLIKGLWGLRRLIIDFRPDVVNSHLVHANILCRLVRALVSFPILVSSAHNTNEEGRLRMLAYRLTDSLANISTNVSDEAVAAFSQQKAVRPGRMLAIYNGIDTKNYYFDGRSRVHVRAELGVTDSEPVLLAVGRLYEQKDYPNLLHAAAELRKMGCSFRLWIAGDGPLRARMLALASSLGIESQVDFLGIRHDIPSLMSACDVYVLSSAWEGLPMVLLEAMACERVVVATDCGGVRRLLGNTGFLVKIRQSGALAEALYKALKLSPDNRLNCGRLARAWVEDNYSLATTAQHYLSLYVDD